MGALVSALLSWFGVTLGDIWNVLKTYLGAKWAIMVAVAGAVFAILSNAADMGAFLLDYLSEMFTPIVTNLAPSTSLAGSLALINTLFPLAELCTFAIAYAALLGVVTIYRIVKTQIPGILPGGGGA